ncbi:MAG TPA: hypothetical protein VG961_14620, partial [Ignavibacteria bacterium]|nr:hypothetical protein [Ignavibacteria bacterium]
TIHFCHKAGLDYVSCSPFRLPIARLSAAQAHVMYDELLSQAGKTSAAKNPGNKKKPAAKKAAKPVKKKALINRTKTKKRR